jgi:hypothetical protein
MERKNEMKLKKKKEEQQKLLTYSNNLEPLPSESHIDPFPLHWKPFDTEK